ncbi:undecaprenyl-diphosphatase UppP [bacterium]
MQILHATLLGIVQGVGEFLPISSSAHLILIPWLFKFKTLGFSFDVALHFGTTLAIVLYFRKELLEIVKGFASIFVRDIQTTGQDKKFSILIIISTIPAVFAGTFGKNLIETVFRNPFSISIALIVAALYLYYAEIKSKKIFSLEQITYKHAFIIGVYQMFALIPGVSRSGITITAALLLGINKDSATKFSFLMAAPIIFGASILGSAEIFKIGFDKSIALPFCIGIITSATLGYFSIKFLLHYIKNHSFKIFVFYRLIFALSILAFYIF